MTTEVLTSTDALEALVPEWNRLADAVGAQPFGRPGMAVPWWRHLGRGELRVVTVRSAGGELVGVAPFHRRPFGPLAIVRPLGHGMGAVSSYLVAPVKGDVAGLLTDGLLAEGVSAVHAVDVPHGEPGLTAARRQVGLGVHAVLHDECPVIDLGAAPGTPFLLDRPSHSSLRKLLARADRDLRDRSVEVREARTPSEVARAVEQLLPVYDAAEADRPRLHLGKGPLRAFLDEMSATLAADDRLGVLTLWIDGRPAAFDFYVTSGSVTYAILGRFDPAFADCSPGHLLLRAGVERAATAGFERVDLQLGADVYKRRWATSSYDTFDTIIAAERTLPRARAVVAGIDVAFTAKAALRSRRSGTANR